MRYAYVGCRTTRERNARGKGLKVYQVSDDGQWTQVQLVEGLENPSYQCLDNTGSFLYTVHGDKEQVSAFRVDKATGKLTYLGSAAAGGRNPVFLSMDPSNRFCYVATLQGGKVSTLERRADGTLSDPISAAVIPGKEPDAVSYPHQCIQDHQHRYLFVPIQGRKTGWGAVNVYRLEADGSLTQTDRQLARTPDEPRHLAMHPNNRWAYLINEKGNCVTYYQFDAATGKLSPKQLLPSLPQTYTGEGQASAMLVHPNGKFAYASNRIHESVAAFSIEPHTGYLTPIGFTDVLGKTPRFMTFDPSGRVLYVANEDSDTIVAFDVDPDTGRLTYNGTTIHTESPVCIIFSQEV